jgi:hypothetical protein
MNLFERLMIQPILVGVWSKAWICSHSLAGSVGLNPAGAWMFVSCECCVAR